MASRKDRGGGDEGPYMLMKGDSIPRSPEGEKKAKKGDEAPLRACSQALGKAVVASSILEKKGHICTVCGKKTEREREMRKPRSSKRSALRAWRNTAFPVKKEDGVVRLTPRGLDAEAPGFKKGRLKEKTAW